MNNERETAEMIPMPGDFITIREADPTDFCVWAFDGNDTPMCLSPCECYLCVVALERELLLVGPGRRLLRVRDSNLASLLQRIKYVTVPAPPTRVEEDWTALDAAFRITGVRTVALAWYQKMSPLAAQVETEPHGHFSLDGGTAWSSLRDLTLDQPAFQPCPTKATDSTGAGYFGDYFGSAIVPPTGQPITATRVVTAYASSSHGCQELDQVTFDQHVQGVRW